MTAPECDTRRKFDLEKVREQIEAIEDGACPWPEAPEPGRAAGPEDIRAAEERAARRAGAVRRMESRRFSLTVRFFFAVFFTVLLGWLETAAVNGYPMPGPFSAAEHPRAFLGVDAGLLLAVAALCGPALLRGFRSLVTFRAQTDSLLAVAFTGALADVVCRLARPAGSAGGRLVYSAAAAAVLTLYLLGRLARLRRVRHTACALEGGGFYTLRRVTADQKDAALRGEAIACPARVGEPDGMLGGGPAATPADRAARVLAPAVLLAAAGMLALNLWLRRGVAEAFASFAVVCGAGSPAVYELCQALPLLRTSARLRRQRAALTGYAAVRDFRDAGRIVVDADMLFPPVNARIHGIKTFSGARIEEAIVDMASVVIAAEGPLAQAFRSLIRDTAGAPLLRPERVAYREDQGISAVLAGKQIVAGSREILRGCGIQAPPREYEAKYASMGRDLCYLAENGRLIAMFIVEYRVDKKTVSAFRRLTRAGVSMLVRTSDPNISASMIAERFGGHTSHLQVLSGAEISTLTMAAVADRSPVSLFFDGSLRSYAAALTACFRLGGTITAAACAQAAAAALGVALAAWLSLHGGIGVITPVKLLEYQGIWAVPALLIAWLRRS